MGCISCRGNAVPQGSSPPREDIFRGQHWRVAHAFGTALTGWLVVVSLRHIASMSELTREEAAPLGTLLQALSAEVEAVLGAEKAYIFFMAEQAGFEHLHIHVVPRMPGLAADQRGPGIFYYMRQPHGLWVSAAEMDEVALAIRPGLQARLCP